MARPRRKKGQRSRAHLSGRGRPRSLRAIAAGIALLFCAHAEPPTLTHIFPAAAKHGTNSAVTLAGKLDPWPPQVWIDTPGVTFTATPITGLFNVELAPDVATGPHLVRIFNEQGASAPRFFIVSPRPELRDAEPNDVFTTPQTIPELPATVSGRLDKAGDVDSFALTLKRGQTLVAWVQAYVLGSAFDGMLRVVDAEGRQLAFNHDGRTLDPFLAWEAPRDGVFVVQAMGFAYPPGSDVRLTGGEGCVYRLHLTSGPFVRHTVPLAAQRGKKTALQLTGWNLPIAQMEFDGAQCGSPATAELLDVLTCAPLPLSEVAELLEVEPNDTRASAQSLAIPSAVTGRIQQANDEDRYTFTATKQRIYEFKVSGDPSGSPLDAWLAIEGPDGKELARNDDEGKSPDPQITWTAPSDGDFAIAMGDVTHRGGAGFVYRLLVSTPDPSFDATTGTHGLTISPGKTAELKVAIKRTHGFAPNLQLAAQNLPPGITAERVDIPEKSAEATLKLTADASAKSANQPFAVFVEQPDGGDRRPVRYPAKGTDENYTEAVIDWTEQLWLTVLAEPPK